MQHFYQRIPGWFDWERIYQEAVARVPDSCMGRFVELGAWQGKSTAHLAVEIANSGKMIRLDVYDHFKGSPELQESGMPMETEHLCREHLAPVSDIVHLHRMTTLEGARCHADRSLDFVWVDAAHDYDSVCEDLIAWAPKVKTGGWIGGHDMQEGFPGVVRAVHEYFAQAHLLPLVKGSWLVERGKDSWL